MPQLKTVFLTHISELVRQYDNFSLAKSNFSITYKPTQSHIPLDDLFTLWSKEKNEQILRNYFAKFAQTLEESNLKLQMNDRESFLKAVGVRMRHSSVLGNQLFISTPFELLDKNMNSIESGFQIVAEKPATETKNGMLLLQKKWLESSEEDLVQLDPQSRIKEHDVLDAGVSNISNEYKNIRRWRMCEVSFPDNPSIPKESFFLSEYFDVYCATRVLMFPDLVLPEEIVKEARNGCKDWVMVCLGDDLVALSRAKNRWALLQISRYLLEKLQAPPASQITMMKPLRLVLEGSTLKWQLYSPDYKALEGYPPRSKLEFDAVQAGLANELRKIIEKDLESKGKSDTTSEITTKVENLSINES